MIIEMYRDTASGYGLCQDDGWDDNSVELDVPEVLLEYYFKTEIQPHDPDYAEIDYKKWLDEYYIYDDMEDLLDYVIDTEGNLDSIKVVE